MFKVDCTVLQNFAGITGVPCLRCDVVSLLVRSEEGLMWGQTTNPADTTEKYGLEAGLWQVFRSKNANGVSRTEQAKDLLKTYGSAYLLTSISFAIVSFAACYALVSAGWWHGPTPDMLIAKLHVRLTEGT